MIEPCLWQVAGSVAFGVPSLVCIDEVSADSSGSLDNKGVHRYWSVGAWIRCLTISVHLHEVCAGLSCLASAAHPRSHQPPLGSLSLFVRPVQMSGNICRIS